MRTARRVIVTALALVIAWSSLAAAQVLTQVPSDALMLVKVTNARQVSDKFAKLAQTLGVAEFQPGLKDPLGFLKQELGVTDGIKEDGDIVFVFVDPAVTGADSDQSMMLLIPVSDYKQFVGNFEGAQQDGEITQARIGGENSFIVQWGDYAAVSPSKDLVGKRPETAISVKGLSVKELESRDVVFYANMEKLRATVLPELQKNRPEMLAEIERNMGSTAEQRAYIPVAKAAAEQGLNMLERFFQDAQGATIALNLDEGGISTAAMAEFAPGTYGAEKIEALKPAGEKLVRGLPAGDYLMLGGLAFNGKVLIEAINDFATPVLAELDKVQTPQATKVRSFADAFRDYIAAANSQTFGMLATNGQLGQDPLFKQVQITRGDAQALAAAQKTMMETSSDLMEVMPNQAAPVKMSFKVEAGAATVDGVQFDMMTASFEGDAQTPEAMQAQQMASWMYGAGGMTGYYGVLGNTMIGTAGFAEADLSDIVAAAKADEASIVSQAHIQSVAKALPQQRLAEIYIPVDNWVKSGSHYAQQFGMPVQIQLPPDLPPIGIAIATEGTALRANSYIPTDLIQSLIAAGMQAFMAAQGGGGGGL